MAYTIVLTVADTSTEPMGHLAAKVEAQKNQQRGNKRDQHRYNKSCFIHGMSISKQSGCSGTGDNIVYDRFYVFVRPIHLPAQ